MGVQSIALEDVAPITMQAGAADLSALAPEQAVGKKRGVDAQFIAGDDEVTRDDRQKMRRKQKKKTKGNGTAGAGVGAVENDKFQDLKNDSRVIQTNTGSKTGKSEYSKSADFFTRMQQEVSTGISKKRRERDDKDDKEQVQRSNRVKL
mmetsp:Transcript_298/g.674  ORF Transcript_298/g.674 Transcript_298/m.674 type:complete len:149 (+) Transcript_298:2119-2565(+)